MTGDETILLAEDETQVRALTERTLALRGYRVLVAQNGAEAVEMSRSHAGPIDLLLTDVVMPVMGRVQAADAIRTERAGIRVLFMSGYSEESLFREGVEEGVHFLNKPFTPSELDRKVREVLDGVPSMASKRILLLLVSAGLEAGANKNPERPRRSPSGSPRLP